MQKTKTILITTFTQNSPKAFIIDFQMRTSLMIKILYFKKALDLGPPVDILNETV